MACFGAVDPKQKTVSGVRQAGRLVTEVTTPQFAQYLNAAGHHSTKAGGPEVESGSSPSFANRGDGTRAVVETASPGSVSVDDQTSTDPPLAPAPFSGNGELAPKRIPFDE